MNAKELRQKDDAGLGDELLALRKAQFSLRVQLATQQSGNTNLKRQLRKDIARIKTIQHERATAK